MTIALRADFDAGALRALAGRTRQAEVRQRLSALAAIYEGASRAEAAELAGIGRQVLRDWVLRFNAEGPNGLHDREDKGGGGLNPSERCVLHDVIARRIVTVDGVRSATLDQVLDEFRHRTGRSLSTRCLSQHIVRVRTRAGLAPLRP